MLESRTGQKASGRFSRSQSAAIAAVDRSPVRLLGFAAMRLLTEGGSPKSEAGGFFTQGGFAKGVRPEAF